MTNQAEEKLIKARIKLQSRNPFFSYLSLYVKFIKAKEGELSIKSMGVSPDGQLYYDEDFVKGMTDEETIGVLCHEILHLAFLHMLRKGSREHQKWNIAIDLAVNKILVDNNFQLPKNGLIPDNYGEFTFPKGLFKKPFTIRDLDKKTGEEIYDELPELDYTKGQVVYVQGFDEHMENSDEKTKGKSASADLESEWLNRLEEAYVSAKQRGSVPNGMEKYLDEIKKSQINWKALLQKYVQSLIPSDFTWLKRSKRSRATKTYLPSVLKEKIEVCVGIDLSGSIGKEELTEFMSEIIGISKAYHQSLTMRLLTHDVNVHNDYTITNGNIDKIKRLKLKGGGGTSHIPIFDYVKDKVKGCKAVIFFTDGYSDIGQIKFTDYNFNKIFIINHEGTDDGLRKRSDCVTIKMKKNYND